MLETKSSATVIRFVPNYYVLTSITFLYKLDSNFIYTHTLSSRSLSPSSLTLTHTFCAFCIVATLQPVRALWNECGYDLWEYGVSVVAIPSKPIQLELHWQQFIK